ncbi:photosystem II 11 kD protein [Thalassoporum mexicanum PCC 7367]|nr:photosystem II 11 kD protein [Pseudanabaena sp. PCC 7367]
MLKSSLKNIVFKLVALVLVATIALTCTSSAYAARNTYTLGSGNPLTTKELREKVNAGLTGNYVDDTKKLIESLKYTLSLAKDADDRSEAQAETRARINAYSARYRADNSKTGLVSFTTMRTVINSLASYYNGTTKRSVPQRVADRAISQISRAESALEAGR